MTISTDLAISNSMSSVVPKYWLNWQILVAILMNFVDKDGTTKVLALSNKKSTFVLISGFSDCCIFTILFKYHLKGRFFNAELP